MPESDTDLSFSVGNRKRSRCGIALRLERRCRRNLTPLDPRGRLGDVNVLEIGLPWKHRHGTQVDPGDGRILLLGDGGQVVQLEWMVRPWLSVSVGFRFACQS